MVEISKSGSGEGPGWVTASGYSTICDGTDSSPWQNGFPERSVGNLRRDRLDHVIAINERQLRSVIRSYDEY